MGFKRPRRKQADSSMANTSLKFWQGLSVFSGVQAGLCLTVGSTRTPKASLLVPSAFGCGAG
jgi:hypothetical protein